MRNLTTHAQEQSIRIEQEEEDAFSETHVYNPIGWDYLDPRGMRNILFPAQAGKPITPGVQVQLMPEATRRLQVGMPPEAKRMFNVVRDAAGNVQHVNKKSLTRLVRR